MFGCSDGLVAGRVFRRQSREYNVDISVGHNEVFASVQGGGMGPEIISSEDIVGINRCPIYAGGSTEALCNDLAKGLFSVFVSAEAGATRLYLIPAMRAAAYRFTSFSGNPSVAEVEAFLAEKDTMSPQEKLFGRDYSQGLSLMSIQGRFRQLARIMHPDKAPSGRRELYEEAFMLVSQAKDALKRPFEQQETEYDRLYQEAENLVRDALDEIDPVQSKVSYKEAAEHFSQAFLVKPSLDVVIKAGDAYKMAEEYHLARDFLVNIATFEIGSQGNLDETFLKAFQIQKQVFIELGISGAEMFELDENISRVTPVSVPAVVDTAVGDAIDSARRAGMLSRELYVTRTRMQRAIVWEGKKNKGVFDAAQYSILGKSDFWSAALVVLETVVTLGANWALWRGKKVGEIQDRRVKFDRYTEAIRNGFEAYRDCDFSLALSVLKDGGLAQEDENGPKPRDSFESVKDILTLDNRDAFFGAILLLGESYMEGAKNHHVARRYFQFLLDDSEINLSVDENDLVLLNIAVSFIAQSSDSEARACLDRVSDTGLHNSIKQVYLARLSASN